MGNTLRCCLACVLPCGALDLIRIVHLNGQVEEITHTVTAGDILSENPNHVLTRPSSEGLVRRIIILNPNSQLKRGGIYFLIPNSSLPPPPPTQPQPQLKSDDDVRESEVNRQSRRRQSHRKRRLCLTRIDDDGGGDDEVQVDDERFLAGMVVVTEKKAKSGRKSQRSKERLSDWKPHLDSITEDF